MLTQEEELAFSWLRFLHMYTNTHVQASMLIFTLQLIHEILTLTPQKQCKPPHHSNHYFTCPSETESLQYFLTSFPIRYSDGPDAIRLSSDKTTTLPKQPRSTCPERPKPPACQVFYSAISFCAEGMGTSFINECRVSFPGRFIPSLVLHTQIKTTINLDLKCLCVALPCKRSQPRQNLSPPR